MFRLIGEPKKLLVHPLPSSMMSKEQFSPSAKPVTVIISPETPDCDNVPAPVLITVYVLAKNSG